MLDSTITNIFCIYMIQNKLIILIRKIIYIILAQHSPKYNIN